ncbi:MAG: potassium channel family protein [Thermoleophilia bacterium]
MAHESKSERKLERWLSHASSPRKAALVIASVTTSLTIVAGVLMRMVDHAGFPTVNSGLWWAVQTVTTVGYGDHVPVTGAGQILASVVMLLGLGFIAVITASITGAFVTRSRDAAHLENESGEKPSTAELQLIGERLTRIEELLRARP